MTNGVPPAVILIAGALVVPVLKGKIKSAYLTLLAAVALTTVLFTPAGSHWTVKVLDYSLIFGRVDALSRVFGVIFGMIAFIGVLFALNVRDDLQHMAALTYAGSALGVTFAGDLITLYIFWEGLAISSMFLILARRTRASQAAAFRYVMVHIFGGLCLLAGIVLYMRESGTTQFGYIELQGLSAWLIFVGIALNAAIPPLHPWLKDAYPESTFSGAVFLCALTTKSAVYVMARTFAGTELLIWLGAAMVCFPLFYALVEDDIRRVLSYMLINQVGFMMCGIGLGTPLALNGAVCHAFCDILYMGLLFMVAGSVMLMTGKVRCTELGGLYRSMPMTCVFCLIGAASISGVPLFNDFVSKSMIVTAAAHEHMDRLWLILEFASVGAFVCAGIKFSLRTFFGPDPGLEAKEPPANMGLAMAIAALLCVGVGVYPEPLYRILPYSVDYTPYTVAHVVDELQLLLFGGLGFILICRFGLYPAEDRAIYLDTDWFYIRAARLFYNIMDRVLNGINAFCERGLAQIMPEWLGRISARPLTTLVMMFERISAKAHTAGMDVEPAERREEVSLLPMGVAVLISLLFLLSLFVTFLVVFSRR
ncbi:MAG: Na(+)/H(+) antiporter subunit D [Deltaproteobacteria bacterium]|nr:Na(+)/H(+) antiporter subunit D [Deltaproteobacteria bacterium]